MMNQYLYIVLSLVILCVSQICTCQSDEITVIQTARDSTDRLTKKPSIRFSTEVEKTDFTIEINQTVTYQKILGFGGALTESSSIVFKQLKPEVQQELLNAYWGPNGNKYTIGRLHINSCDFSTGNYSCDDTPNDFALEHFALQPADLEHVIPFVQAANEMAKQSGYLPKKDEGIQFFASPWSPPAWMKRNGQMMKSDAPNGLKEGDQYLASWALFFSKWITEYQKAGGMKIWGVTAQNEPVEDSPFEQCRFGADLQTYFIKRFLGPVLLKDHPSVALMAHDDMKALIELITKPVLDDPEAAQYIKGIAVHWYSGDDWGQLQLAQKLFPDKFVLATEACECPGVKLDDWYRGEHYAHDIMGDLNNFVVGWCDWNVLLNIQGGPNHINNFCDAPIVADIQNQRLHYQIPYYTMGHFTRYLAPNSVRIGVKVTGPTELEVTSFRTPDNKNTVVIILNRTEKDVSYALRDNKRVAKYNISHHTIQTLVYEN